MELYIKTPFYQDNKYLPHLLEHCALFSFDREDMLTYFCDVSGYVAYGHTCFDFTLSLSIADVFHKITQPIPLEAFAFQKNVLATELKEISEDKKWWEKAYQHLTDNKNIRANTVPSGMSLELLHEYQNTWYQEKNMILAQDDHEIDTTF